MFTANRIAAISGAATGLAALIAGLAQVLPGTWPNYALAASGLLTKLAVVVTYLRGSQLWDKLTAGLPSDAQEAAAPPPPPVVVSEEPPPPPTPTPPPAPAAAAPAA